jgi:hypothetical protein
MKKQSLPIRRRIKVVNQRSRRMKRPPRGSDS